MRKGRHRRHQQARALKQARFEPAETAAAECEECRRTPHADWCLADDGRDDSPE